MARMPCSRRRLLFYSLCVQLRHGGSQDTTHERFGGTIACFVSPLSSSFSGPGQWCSGQFLFGGAPPSFHPSLPSHFFPPPSNPFSPLPFFPVHWVPWLQKTVTECTTEFYYGHTMMKQGSWLKKEIMQRTMPGARRRGRPRTVWMDNFKTGLPVEESIRMIEDKDEWRKYVHGVANSRIEDS